MQCFECIHCDRSVVHKQTYGYDHTILDGLIQSSLEAYKLRNCCDSIVLGSMNLTQVHKVMFAVYKFY